MKLLFLVDNLKRLVIKEWLIKSIQKVERAYFQSGNGLEKYKNLIILLILLVFCHIKILERIIVNLNNTIL